MYPVLTAVDIQIRAQNNSTIKRNVFFVFLITLSQAELEDTVDGDLVLFYNISEYLNNLHHRYRLDADDVHICMVGSMDSVLHLS